MCHQAVYTKMFLVNSINIDIRRDNLAHFRHSQGDKHTLPHIRDNLAVTEEANFDEAIPIDIKKEKSQKHINIQ